MIPLYVGIIFILIGHVYYQKYTFEVNCMCEIVTKYDPSGTFTVNTICKKGFKYTLCMIN